MVNGRNKPRGKGTKFYRRGFIALAAVLPCVALADQWLGEGWVFLGESKINLLKNFTVVPVTLEKGLFSALVIEAVGKPIFIESVEVSFSNGEKVDLPIRSIIGAGGRTRKMLLPGLVRGIRVVKVIYERVPTGGSATVLIFGRQSGG